MTGGLEIVIPGEPCAQGRPRFSRRNGIAYDPPKSRNWKATAQQHMAAALLGVDRSASPLCGPVACQVVATFTCPMSDARKRTPRPRRWHTKLPDLENVVKAVLDAGTGILWLDDRQIVKLTAVKITGRQGEAPKVWLTVDEVLMEPQQ